MKKQRKRFIWVSIIVALIALGLMQFRNEGSKSNAEKLPSKPSKSTDAILAGSTPSSGAPSSAVSQTPVEVQSPSAPLISSSKEPDTNPFPNQQFSMFTCTVRVLEIESSNPSAIKLIFDTPSRGSFAWVKIGWGKSEVLGTLNVINGHSEQVIEVPYDAPATSAVATVYFSPEISPDNLACKSN